MKRIDEIAARVAAEKFLRSPEWRHAPLSSDAEIELLTQFLLASQKKMREALQAVVGLFRDSSFYIKKLGLPITNGDQERIDRAFILAEAALKGEGENV
jgi:hypothetical protein